MNILDIRISYVTYCSNQQLYHVSKKCYGTAALKIPKNQYADCIINISRLQIGRCIVLNRRRRIFYIHNRKGVSWQKCRVRYVLNISENQPETAFRIRNHFGVLLTVCEVWKNALWVEMITSLFSKLDAAAYSWNYGMIVPKYV